MTNRTDYSDLTKDLTNRVGIPVPMCWPLMAEAVVRDASNEEIAALFAMMTRRMRIIANLPKNEPRDGAQDPTGRGWRSNVKGCKTGRIPATSTGETGELPASLVGFIECLPWGMEPDDDDDNDEGPTILPMSLANDGNIDLAT